MNYQFRSRTPGFTLIELLVVMGIIMILAGIVIGVQRGVYYQQSKARAVAEMRTIASGLESFKLTYGDYPPMTRPSPSGTPVRDETAATRLFAALTGRSILQGRGSPPVPRWFNDPNPDSDDSGTENPSFGLTVNGPVFIEPNAIKRGGTTTPANYWVDPWGQTYNYYYKEATSAEYNPKATTGWAGRSSFILVSPGPRRSPQSMDYDDGGRISDANLPANSRRYYNNTSEGGLVPSGKVRSEIIYNYGE